jgi:protein-S-isoprenylcysteine O-methyltransferase Ste14
MLPPAWFLLSLVAAVALHWLLPGPPLVAPPYTLSGLALIVLGLVLVVAPARSFDRVKTEINPFGQPSMFVTNGWFRFSRNPMYLGMVLVTVGLAVLVGTATSFLAPVLLWIVLDRRFVQHEEKTLVRTFGAEYLAYQKRVRRWF